MKIDTPVPQKNIKGLLLSLLLIIGFGLFTGCSVEQRIQKSINSFADTSITQTRLDEYLATLVEIGETSVTQLITSLENPKNSQQSEYIVRALGEIGDPRAVTALISSYEDYPENYQAYATSLMNIAPDDPMTVYLAIKCIGDGGTIEETATHYLEERGPEFIQSWSFGITRPENEVRIKIYDYIDDFSPEEQIRILSDALYTEDAEILKEVADHLIKLGSQETQSALDSYLGEQIVFLREMSQINDPELQAKTATLLSYVQNGDANYLLTVLSNSPYYEVKKATTLALVRRGDLMAEATLWMLLLGEQPVPDDDIPFLVDQALSLGDLPVEYISEFFIFGTQTQFENAEKIARYTDENLFEEYLESYVVNNDMSSEIKVSAINAIGKLEFNGSGEFLNNVIFERRIDFEARLAAINTLSEEEALSVVPVMVEMLNDENSKNIKLAYEFLKQHPSEAVANAFGNICQSESHPYHDEICISLSVFHPDYLSSMVEALESEKIRAIANAYLFYLFWDVEKSQNALIQALNRYGTVEMCNSYLNLGTPEMVSAAMEWATAHGYEVISFLDFSEDS